MKTYEYIEKVIEASSGYEAKCWRVWKIEMYPGQNVSVKMILQGWKDMDAFLADKSSISVTEVNFDHAELMEGYGVTFAGLLAKILADNQFVGGTYKTVEVAE